MPRGNVNFADTARQPAVFALDQNTPNPFNPTTTISYELSVASEVSLRIYDIAGRVVRTLRSGSTEEPGTHRVVWDGRDGAGRTLASGMASGASRKPR